ncbi:MAG: NADH-quinone oxidoreductase subunit L [Verrucomicrobiales bacterium]
MNQNQAWLILFLPLISAAVITLFTRRQQKISALISIAAVAVSFLLSVFYFLKLGSAESIPVSPIHWLSVGALQVDIGIVLDRLSLMMLLVVTGVGLLIHIYSYGYMAEDPGFSRFFACLSLFMFSMLGIVLSNNFFQMFIFWELVGLSSYLLIGFWFTKPSAADACKKAFLTNRIGDFGFLLGIIILWTVFGSVHFEVLRDQIAANPAALGAMASLTGILIFFGAMGKSAQFPLHVWLPDAMEGPTPVSALIHAATMVAAGVYMLARAFFVYSAVPLWPEWLSFMGSVTALDIIAYIGAFTALLAALIAVQQNDIKRILAYSTLSQLGYMIMAIGLAGTVPAMFHLTTHAFFKALLFLGAGSVIHAMHHEQDIWMMGGLSKKLPSTYRTFLLGTLALAGLWPMSGFFSKDEVLYTAYHAKPLLFAVGILVATLTTFYMFRLMFVVFYGGQRTEAASHAHESPAVMTAPLWILAVPTVIGGIIGIDAFLKAGADHHGSHSILGSLGAPWSHAPFVAVASLAAFLFGLFFAYGLYRNATTDPLPEIMRPVARAMRNRFYFDELYTSIIALTHENLAKIANGFDRWIISGLVVKGIHGSAELTGRALRLFQTGNLQTYALLLVMGIAVLLLIFFRF